MSLILDALRKAERERNLGHAPTLADVTQTPPKAAPPVQAQHRRVQVLAAIVLLLLVLTVVLWARTEPVPSAPATREVVVAESAPPAYEPVFEPESDGQYLDPDQAMTDPEYGEGPQSLDELIEPRGVSSVASAKPAAEDLYVPPEPYEIEIPAEVPATPESPIETPAAAIELPAVRNLREMPSTYRANFPTLRIEVHVHNADPAKRWFLLGGTRFVEGVDLPEGPRVVEITPKGVIFNYRGETVLYPLDR